MFFCFFNLFLDFTSRVTRDSCGERVLDFLRNEFRKKVMFEKKDLKAGQFCVMHLVLLNDYTSCLQGKNWDCVFIVAVMVVLCDGLAIGTVFCDKKAYLWLV